MTCPRCGQMYAGLACPACWALQSHAAVEAHQGMYLNDVRKGKRPFYAKRLSESHPWHLMLFGDKAHGLCGIEIKSAGKRNWRDFPYADLSRNDLCPKCLHKLRDIEEREAIREES